MSYRRSRDPDHQRRPGRFSGEAHRGLNHDDPARNTPDYVPIRPPEQPRPEPWGDSRFTRREPHEHYRGPNVPGAPETHIPSDAYDPPDTPPLFVGRPPLAWPASEDPNWPRAGERPPTYRDGMMSRAEWQDLITRQFPNQPGPGTAPDFPLGDAGGNWPMFDPDIPAPTPDASYAPIGPADFADYGTSSMPGTIEPPGIPAPTASLPAQPMFQAPEPTLEERIADPMQDFQHGFGPAMPEPFDPGLSFAQFPEPPDPFGGLEQRLMEPPPFDPFPLPPPDLMPGLSW